MSRSPTHRAPICHQHVTDIPSSWAVYTSLLLHVVTLMTDCAQQNRLFSL